MIKRLLSLFLFLNMRVGNTGCNIMLDKYASSIKPRSTRLK